jgi:hypothetical protein
MQTASIPPANAEEAATERPADTQPERCSMQPVCTLVH